ncbi:hypothetical protein [Cohnella luojiensis]|uniref:Uncharacterized protein n=1 Tax=Cohnella luojiensis TaxID=652876 RepID=A0A4Y8M3C9_9BACL|nr:hypothetical protein [Cohnella luojiensis]TFE29967.1 hypothetical protein E2980_04210 [Cohnella luojiensis]
MKDNNENERYKSDFAAWSDRIERLLMKGILLLVILLVVSQLVLRSPIARQWMTTTDEIEGVPFHYVAH